MSTNGDRQPDNAGNHSKHAEETALQKAVREGRLTLDDVHSGTASGAAESRFFHDVHGMSEAQRAAVTKELAQQGFPNVTLTEDAQFKNQIHLNVDGQEVRTAAYFKDGKGLNAEVVMDNNEKVLGTTYYHTDKNGNEFRIASGALNRMPQQGMWEDAPLNNQSDLQTAMQRLDILHSMGIKVVTFPTEAASTQLLGEYAQHADKLGMKIIWDITGPGSNNPWLHNLNQTNDASANGDFSAFTSNHSDSNATVLSNMMNFLKTQKATYGYYAMDDSVLPSLHQKEQVGNLANYLQQVHSLDPNHEVMVSTMDIGQYKAYQQFIDRTLGKAGTLSLEEYPSAGPGTGFDTNVPRDIKTVAKDSRRNGEPATYFLQAMSWGTEAPGDKYPGFADQLSLRNDALKDGHAQTIQWYRFDDTYGSSWEGPYPAGQPRPGTARSAEYVAQLDAAIKAPVDETK